MKPKLDITRNKSYLIIEPSTEIHTIWNYHNQKEEKEKAKTNKQTIANTKPKTKNKDERKRTIQFQVRRESEQFAHVKWCEEEWGPLIFIGFFWTLVIKCWVNDDVLMRIY